MNRVSKFWWLPLARRVLGWGLAGALVWALPIFLLGTVASFVFALGEWLHWSAFDFVGRLGVKSVWLIIFVYIALAGSANISLLGAIIGIVAGFYASPTDTKNPLKSRFFRSVSRQTFWFWLATSLVGVPTFAAFVYFAVNPLLSQTGLFALGCGLAFSALLFILSLWRAVNRALLGGTSLANLSEREVT